MALVDLLLTISRLYAAFVALGVSVTVALVVLAVTCLKHGERRAKEAGTPVAGPEPAFLPRRVPGKAFDEHADDMLAMFAPIPEPTGQGAKVVDHDRLTWTRTSPASLNGGFWCNKHGVALPWEALRLRHPRLTDPGVELSDQALLLADDSIPLADIHLDDLAFAGSVLADLDDLATYDGEQR